MLAVDVATVDVDVRLLLRLDASVLTGQHEGVESDGALRPPRVDLLNLVLQLSPTLEATTSVVMYREVSVIETLCILHEHWLDSGNNSKSTYFASIPWLRHILVAMPELH